MDRESLSETDKRGDRVSKGDRMYLISPLGIPNIYQNMQTGNLSVLMVHVFHVTIVWCFSSNFWALSDII